MKPFAWAVVDNDGSFCTAEPSRDAANKARCVYVQRTGESSRFSVVPLYRTIIEASHPEPAQAQVSDAEVEAACVAAYSACDMGSFPAMAVEPDSDRRIIRAAIEAAARARGTGEALAGDIARRAIAAQSSAKGVE